MSNLCGWAATTWSQLDANSRKIVAMMLLVAVYFVVELGVGTYANSLALVSDAFHMLSDGLGLVVGLAAIMLGKQASTLSFTYGWVRTEILGGLINGVMLLTICFFIFLDAIQRFIEPPTIDRPMLILVVGSIGMLINIIGLLVFWGDHPGHGHSHGHGHSEDESHQHDATTTVPASAALQDKAEKKKKKKKHSHGHAHGHEHGHSPASGSSASSPFMIAEDDHHEGHHGHRDRDDGNDDDGADEEAGHSHAHAHRDLHDNNGATATTSNVVAAPAHSHGGGGNLNMTGVFLHVLGDFLGSVGVVVTAILIMLYGHNGKWGHYDWVKYADPVISLILTGIILLSAVPLVIRCARILLQSVPKGVDVSEITAQILTIDGVLDVHEFHLWELVESKLIASVHLRCHVDYDIMQLSAQVKSLLHEYGIHSSTIQAEAEEQQLPVGDCRLECAVDCVEERCCKRVPHLGSDGME